MYSRPSSPLLADAAIPDFIGALSPDGLHLATAGPHHTVELWNSRLSQRLLTYSGHQDGIYRRLTGRILAIAWSPDGTRIVSASSNGSLHVWDARTGIHQRTLLLASLDGKQSTISEQECELVWDADGLHLHRQDGSQQEPEQRVWYL